MTDRRAPGWRTLAAYGTLRAPLALVELPLFVLLPAFYQRSQGLDLARNFESKGTAHTRDRIEIFDLDLGSKFFGANRADRYIDIAAELSFLHVGVTNAAIDHDLLEHCEVSKGFFGRGNIRLANDFE